MSGLLAICATKSGSYWRSCKMESEAQDILGEFLMVYGDLSANDLNSDDPRRQERGLWF